MPAAPAGIAGPAIELHGTPINAIFVALFVVLDEVSLAGDVED